MPMACAPASATAFAVSASRIPQILIQVDRGMVEGALGDWLRFVGVSKLLGSIRDPFPRDKSDRVETPRMTAFSHHVFVCGNQRTPGHRRGCCDPAGQDQLRGELKALVQQQGLGTQVRINKAGCLEQCEHGPTLVIYPQGIWYGGVTRDDLPRIVAETIQGGRILEDLLIRDECLNNPECEHLRDRRSTDSGG